MKRLQQLFTVASDRDPADRADYLDRECGSDSALRDEVLLLLRHHDSAGDFLESPAVCSLPGTGADDPASGSDSLMPGMVRDYEILGVLGRGGMGVVYRARCEKPPREVALKVIRPGVASMEMLRRFGQEAYVLGRLHHPGIARIFEAGTADTGAGQQPFFAMEVVEGPSLTEYARRCNLGPCTRLEILAKVCDAVQHAHSQGVIHRDLKPANIVVNAAGEPKILDFGVARAIDVDTNITSTGTSLGRLVGTAPYMSPEQVRGGSEGVDARSDVYTLGVVAFELLVGRLPYDLAGKSIAEIARVIVEEPPGSLGALDRRLRGDIDTVVAKALEKSPQRRYQSAADLAADIRRCLRYEPIHARRLNAICQLSRFARRNRMLMAGVAIVFLVLLLGIIGTGAGFFRARAAEQCARRQALVARQLQVAAQAAETQAHAQARQAAAVRDFLIRMLTSADPRTGGRDVRVIDVLARETHEVDATFADHAELRAALHDTIGKTYYALGLYAEAEQRFVFSLRTYRELLGDEHSTTLSAMCSLAMARQMLGNLDEAETLFREMLATRIRLFGPQHVATAADLNNLGNLLCRLGRLDEAEEMLRRGMDIRRRILGVNDLDTLGSMQNLAAVLESSENLAEADALYRRTLAGCRKLLGDHDPRTLITLAKLAAVVRSRGHPGEADQFYRDIMGDGHCGIMYGIRR